MTDSAQNDAVTGEHMHYACMAAGCRLRDALDEAARYREALNEIWHYDIVDDEDTYLDAKRMADIAGVALDQERHG